MKIGFRAIMAAAFALAVPQTAHSQGFAGAIMASLPDVIGQTLSGSFGSAGRCDVFADKGEQFEAHAPGIALMTDYYVAASAGKPWSGLFSLTRKTKWSAGGKVADRTDLDAQTDPLAVPANVLDTSPLRFYRAGTFGLAHGQWVVHGPDGGVAGLYDALFEREGGTWKFRELTVLGPDDEVVPAHSFCRKPGDMTEYGITTGKRGVELAEKRFEKRKAKFAAADDKARTAQAKAEEKPDSGRLAATAKKLRSKADSQAEKLNDAKELLAESRENLAKAQMELADYKALIGPVRNAEHFRETYDTKADD